MTEITADDVPLSDFVISIDNEVKIENPFYVPVPPPSFSASFRVGPELYESLNRDAFYTFEMVVDHNPWHRTAITRGERAQRLLKGLRWNFRKYILRRALIETTKVTVPNCRLTGST